MLASRWHREDSALAGSEAARVGALSECPRMDLRASGAVRTFRREDLYWVQP
jgi:hypothetical protein